ncbi:response regulator transcription factor [Kribbella sp. HUAS MG21]|uniref:Response regulator transcription factor n=1 Tax=Kribbella sp. HUAS MG21 TaxID=3160966 RepID=A0AAU7T8C4_9ACTN
MEGEIRIVMADDHPPTRSRIRDLLEAGGFVVSAEAANAADVIRMALEHRPDVVLLDIHMPGNGIRAAAELSRSLPGTRVVMLTHSRDDEDLFDALRAGAVGYLLKDDEPDRLTTGLRQVMAGEASVSASVVTRILQEFRAPARRLFSRRSAAAAKLSSREWEVMELLSQGLSTEEVAKRLFLSPTTVRVHVSTVLRKLRVKDRQSAIDLLREE